MKCLLKRLLVLLCVFPVALSGWTEEDLRRFVIFDSSYGLADNSAQTIKCTKTGRMVISTIGHINFYDGAAFAHIDPTAADVMELPGYNGHYHLYFDRFHHLWLKDKRQVTCVNLTKECFIEDVAGVLREMGIDKPVDDLFGDHDNHMWFRQGSWLCSPEYNTVIPVSDHAELLDMDVRDSKEVLLFYADGLLSVYDLRSRRHLYDSRLNEGGIVDDDYERSAVVSLYDGIYYQIRNGQHGAVLQSFHPGRREWKLLLKTPYHLNNVTPHDGRLFVPCEYGYWVYDIAGGQFCHVEKMKMVQGHELLTDINDICFDRQGGMWMGTERRGLLYSRPFPSPFHLYGWEQLEAMHLYNIIDAQQKGNIQQFPRHVNCVVRDSRGWTWTGTYSGLLLNRGRDDSLTFTRKDGFTNDMIHSVIEDGNNNMWVGTSSGISKLEIQNGEVVRITSYDKLDNLPSESFVNNRVARLPDGTIVMQSLDHIVTFHPDEFYSTEMRQTTLLPKLTRLLVNGHDVKPGADYDGTVIIDRAVTRVSEINVRYNQNSLMLTFTGLNYWRPIQTYYRVRIKGVMDEWKVYSYYNSQGMVDRNGMLRLPLNGLSPGQYIIELQASMTPDNWSTRPFLWSVRVSQPWWRSTGVYLLLVILMLILIAVNFMVFSKNSSLRLHRNNAEDDMLRRIRGYAERCHALRHDFLTPYSLSLAEGDGQTGVDMDFVRLMLSVVPYVNSRRQQQYSIGDLARIGGVDVPRFYDLMSANLYKNPLRIVLGLRLRQAATQLRNSADSIDDIASQCGFVSPNFFIASFYHLYKQTPFDYRNSAPR